MGLAAMGLAAMGVAATGLESAACRLRQERLRAVLAARGLDAALAADRRHVHYLTGFWCRSTYAPLTLVGRNEGTVLIAPYPPTHPPAAEETLVYEAQRHCTLVDDQLAAALAALGSRLRGVSRLGCDRPLGPWLAGCDQVNLLDAFLRLRRAKDPDEVALLRRALEATEAAYVFARSALNEGADEVELFAGMQAAAARSAGEILGEFGNDFQIGATGSLPRRRPARRGEIAILDLSVDLRGYHSDMCRSFVVGREPSPAQLAAHGRVLDVLEQTAAGLRPGARCQELFEAARQMLDGFRGWSFPHHLGHGIGLSPHEAPRLNSHWDDVLEPGDVLTVEPGLYGDELRAGVRVEQVFRVAETGAELLTRFPTALC